MEVLTEKTGREIVEKLDKLLLSRQEVFNQREAAEYLRISYDQFGRLVRSGKIMYKNKGTGDQKIFKKVWLDEWLEN